MPVEVTDKYIRVEVRPAGDFQEDSLRTITLSADQGIKAIVGRLPDETTTTIAVYLFDREKWDRKRAQAWVNEHKESGEEKAISGLAQFLLEGAYKAAGDREKLEAAREARSKRYKIGVKEGGNLTPPRGYPSDEADYGDPVNYRYPIDQAHIKPAVSYFNQDGQREDGGYTSGEWAIVGGRIASRASKLIAPGYKYAEGKVSKSEEAAGEGEGKSWTVKAVSLDAQIGLVRQAWAAQLRPPADAPQAQPEERWIREVFDDRVIVEGPGGFWAYPYTIEDGAVKFGEGQRVEINFTPAEGSEALAVKALDRGDGGLFVGGYLLLWGSPEERDLGRQYFTKSTELWLDRYPVVPAMFHHGLDPQVGLSVIGRRIKAIPDERGVWVKHWLDVSNRFWDWVEPLLEGGRLRYSPGSANHLVRTDRKTGEIFAFPVVEDTLTPVPAQHRLKYLPVQTLKAAYAEANLQFPADLGGGGPVDPRQVRLRLQAKLLQQRANINAILLEG